MAKFIHKYDVYGATRSGSGTSTSKHKFVGGIGHTSEDNTGLVYMRARYYDPSIGRFISEDPAQNGLNWYIYCENNPTNFSDATGKYAQVVALALLLTLIYGLLVLPPIFDAIDEYKIYVDGKLDHDPIYVYFGGIVAITTPDYDTGYKVEWSTGFPPMELWGEDVWL